MKWYTNLRVRQKLLVSFSTVIIFVVALVLLAVISINKLNNSYTYLLEFPEKSLEHLMALDTDYSEMQRAVAMLAVFADKPDALNEYWMQVEQYYESALGHIDQYMEITAADTVRDEAAVQESLAVMDDLKYNLEDYKIQIADQALGMARATFNQEKVITVTTRGATAITRLQTTVRDLVKQAQDHTIQVAQENMRSKVASDIIFIVLSVIIIVISVTIAIAISGMISKPLIAISNFFNKAGSTGDINFAPEDLAAIEKYSLGHDEIGQCVNSSANFIARILDVGKSLELVANGDLTVEMNLLSEKDTMGTSLKKMIGGLNELFSRINLATVQVSAGSRQIAQGAQSLAQGSSEQASAVEELSISVGEITETTRKNADMAVRAATLGNTIRNNAEKGSQQMDQMMSAVQEINEASKSINKVIKVIDDIAFQTNILALNAAVEAARAGQHGKGFAVVAEEVRNLAAKSAEAAKDTGSLIANSMSKAELGARIAGETASSLTEIVTGIKESSQIVSDIAKYSEEQAEAIAQLNRGIDQVTQVVQQNSATAEQSAAASQELSGQSNTLEELLTNFKLKEQLKMQNALPGFASKTPESFLEPDIEVKPDAEADFGKY